MHRYVCWNGLAPTTAGLVKVTTGTSIKTMLQVATPSTRMIQLIQWGYSLDAVPASAGQVELLQTDVGATITQHVAAGIMPLTAGSGFPNSLMDISSTTKTGYTSSNEGSITATRLFGSKLVPPTAGADDLNYDFEFMPDARPTVDVSKYLRIRVTFGAAVNMSCYVIWDE